MKISIRDLSKTYVISKDVAVDALKNMDLDIEQGEFCALVGPSGSGKTTLFNLLGCIDRPTGGRIFFDQEEITGLKEDDLMLIRRYKIGYIFQFFNLIPTLTAFENAGLPFWDVSAARKKECTENLDRVFREIGIMDLKKRYPKHLSGGQEQRVAIARSLANFPKLVLADEPTGNLDSRTAVEIINLMKRENELFKTTVLVATHDLALLKYFNKIIYLKDGMIDRVVSQGATFRKKGRKK